MSHAGEIILKLKLETHRGITTNPNPRNEIKLKTIINRFGQKSISLPRIDNKKRFGGYPGNTGIAKRLSRLIPKCTVYVEPFAGMAKVCQELFAIKRQERFPETFILNDKAKPISKWLRQEFPYPDVKVTCTDFIHCIKKYDAPDTVFLIDHPWFKSSYDQSFSYFDRNRVIDYDKQVLELCHSIKGKFFITTRIENTRMKKSGFKNLLIQSEYVVMGKYPKVLITTNISKEDYN